MLKINLLPPYVRERKRIMVTIAFMAPLLFIIVGGIFAWWLSIGKEIKAINAQKVAVEPNAQEAERLQGETAAVEQSNRDMLSVVDFIDSIREYDKKLPGLLELVSSWTYAKVQINGLQLAGSGPGGTWDRFDLSCSTDTVDSLFASMQNLWNATNAFSQASLTGLTPSISYPLGSDTSGGGGGMPFGGGTYGTPGFQGGGTGLGLANLLGAEQQGFRFQVSFMLKEPIQVPELGASAAGAAGGMGPGPSGPGAPPSGPGAPPSGPTAPPSGPTGGGGLGGRGLGGGMGEEGG
jgi:hypothetical protein